MVFAWCSFNRNFRCKSPAFAKPFPVMCNFIKTVYKTELKTKYNVDFSELRKVINSWNLIPGSPNDEFDHLNDKILNQFYKNPKRDKILRILESYLVVYYGLYCDKFNGEEFADGIIQGWNNKN